MSAAFTTSTDDLSRPPFTLRPAHACRTMPRFSERKGENVMAAAKSPVPQGFHTVTPQIIYDNAAEAIEWYKKALGAEEKSRALGPDGKIMHAEIRIGSSVIMLNDAMGGGKSAKTLGGSPISMWVYVPDCDALFNRAVGAGAQVPPGPMGQVMDQFWGDRSGSFTDPFGHYWTIATRKEDLTRQELDKRAEDFFKQFAPQQPAHS
jgi:PhnB protein